MAETSVPALTLLERPPQICRCQAKLHAAARRSIELCSNDEEADYMADL